MDLRRLPLPPLRDLVLKRPSTGPNIDALDGIRGLAVLLVIAAHAGAFGLAGHGAVGVWLFFALSAFLLTMPFAADPDRLADPGKLAHYALRRLLRIVPPYYAFLAAWALWQPDARPAVVRHALFLQGDVHLWSIPQEMLFYVLLPPLAALHPLAFRRRPGATALGLLAAAVLCSLLLDASVVSLRANGHPQRLFLSVFLCGMAACYAHRWPPLLRLASHPRASRALGAASVALLLGLVLTARAPQRALAAHFASLGAPAAPMGWTYPGSFGASCAALILICMLCPGSPVHRLAVWRPLRALGLVSYSAYLLHVPVVVFLERRLGVERGEALFAVALAVTYLGAALSYTAIERPFLRIGGRG